MAQGTCRPVATTSTCGLKAAGVLLRVASADGVEEGATGR